jgi:hypothetical protein
MGKCGIMGNRGTMEIFIPTPYLPYTIFPYFHTNPHHLKLEI